MGFGGLNQFYIGGKVYNYEGLNWTRKSYYLRPSLEVNFQGEVFEFQPDSEGYFWVEVPIKSKYKLSSGYESPNFASIALDKYQDRKNKNIILVTDYGLNTKEIEIPFMMPDQNSKFGIISDFDNTITRVKGLGIIEYITTNPKIFRLRNGIVDVYNKITDELNPIFYVTARPNGTYKVVKTIIEENSLPVGPIMARDLGFWFLNKGLSVKDHKIQSIETILETLPEKRFILIGDNSKYDEKIYLNIQEKYPKRIIKIFIFKVKRPKYKNNKYISYIEKPQQITDELIALGLVNK